MIWTKYVLGTYAPGSRVQLADERFSGVTPGMWVRIVGNYSRTTGVVVVEVERTKARIEKDGRAPLVNVDSDAKEFTP